MDSYILFHEHTNKEELPNKHNERDLTATLDSDVKKPILKRIKGNYLKAQDAFDYYSVNQVYRYTIKALIEGLSIRSFN